MSNLSQSFKNKKAFIAFITAGDGGEGATVEYVKTLYNSGADIVELGIPFSDPIADGEVIQAANLRAFKEGITTDGVFSIVEKIRKDCDVSLVFLTYLNPVFKYGYDAFCRRCADLDVGGLVVPDLPFEEKPELKVYTDKYGVDIIPLIAPTSGERAQKIAADSGGFIYIVSSMGITGVRDKITTDLRPVISRIRKVTKTPAAVGFGISTPSQAREIASEADGIIIGSAIVKIIEKYGKDAAPYLAEYAKSIKKAINF